MYGICKQRHGIGHPTDDAFHDAEAEVQNDAPAKGELLGRIHGFPVGGVGVVVFAVSMGMPFVVFVRHGGILSDERKKAITL